MDWEKTTDAIIRESIENGDFDDLPGKGKPLNLDDYFATPAEWRVGFSLLKNANVLPEILALHSDIERLKRLIENSSHPEEKIQLKRKLNEQQTKMNIEREQFRKRR